jgi:tetratricopeptide (TPR) repeat protein
MMYAGEFAKAASEAQRVVTDDPSLGLSYLPLAVNALDERKLDQAAGIYERAAATGSVGASLAAIGLADMAMYVGKYADAARRLEAGIAADRQDGNSIGESSKVVALVEAHVSAGRSRDAERAIAQALTFGSDDWILVPVARAYLVLNRVPDAQRIIAELSGRLQPESRAYGRLLEAEHALKRNQFRDAIAASQDARRHADLWLVRFVLGLSYFQAEHYAEALSEFEACLKRRGEASAIFFDDQPTFRYLATLPYWLGRSQEALGQRDAAVVRYREFLAPRDPDATDALVVDARQRIAAGSQVTPPR